LGYRRGNTMPPCDWYFPLFIFVADFAILVGKKKDSPGRVLRGVNFRGQRRGVADLQGDEAFPFGLERRYVHDDSAAGVRGFAKANGEHVAWNPKIFHRAGQRERIRRDEAGIAFVVDQRTGIEMLGIDDGGIHVGEDAKFIGDANVVAVG